MVEKLKAKDGSCVLRHRGRFLGSSRNPTKEACNWLKAQEIRSIKAMSFIVLGAGSGYHVKLLAEEYPGSSIVVIDNSKEVLERVKLIHGLSLACVQFIHIESTHELMGKEVIRRIVRGPYNILQYKVSQQIFPVFYSQIFEFLTGRNQEGFSFLMSARPIVANLYQKMHIQSSETSGNKLLSIIDLAKPITDLQIEDNFSRQIMALRELVK